MGLFSGHSVYYLLYFGLSREIARPIRWRTEWQVNGRT